MTPSKRPRYRWAPRAEFVSTALLVLTIVGGLAVILFWLYAGVRETAGTMNEVEFERAIVATGVGGIALLGSCIAAWVRRWTIGRELRAIRQMVAGRIQNLESWRVQGVLSGDLFADAHSAGTPLLQVRGGPGATMFASGIVAAFTATGMVLWGITCVSASMLGTVVEGASAVHLTASSIFFMALAACIGGFVLSASWRTVARKAWAESLAEFERRYVHAVNASGASNAIDHGRPSTSRGRDVDASRSKAPPRL